MMKRIVYILALLLTGFWFSCSRDEILMDNPLTPEQESLIGRAVNFNVSYAEPFTTRASSYTDILDGGFNQNDRMRIYRNYYDSEQKKWEDEEAYRTYRHVYLSDASTGIDLGKDWQVEKGRKGYDKINSVWKTFTQDENDSLTWENGKTVRFRAWSLSNYHNVLNNATKKTFYPDFSMSDFVTASGPSTSIPMVLKHLGCRIKFEVLQSGNEFYDIRLCTTINPDGTDNADGWKDYMYRDNADTNEHDSEDANITEDEAKQRCEAVTSIFKRMCMPAGVDIKSGTLKAVKNTWWKNSATDAQVRALEEQEESNFITYKSSSPADIASQAKRPFFSIINTYPMMITIPYDISNDAENGGEVLVLPPHTRFRVYLRDVNRGDAANTAGDQFDTSGYEGAYHIFALSDINETDASGNVLYESDGVTPKKKFPEGLKLAPGLSYTFRVGYRYDGLYVMVNNNLSWTDEAPLEATASNKMVDPTENPNPYKWWQDAIKAAIPTGTEDFKPVFHIANETQFLEFIKLVNGSTGATDDGLYLLDFVDKDAEGKPVTIKRWSKVNSIYKPDWVEEEEMVKEGYIFYDHYHAANADKAAYSERDYLKGPYPFYDDDLHRNFSVVLDRCLDLKDWSLESIGAKESTPFRGCFDGQGHIIKNLFMKNENLFGFVNGIGTEHASITNLRIESLHYTCLVGTGMNQLYIAGVSIHAPSSTNSIAHTIGSNVSNVGASYVVGCIHVGDAGGALVGTASNMNMFGCMQAAHGITGGALIGTDATKVFTPQISLKGQKEGTKVDTKPTFKNFIANYYDKEISSSANAVGSTTDDYSLLEYIRGSSTDILRAKNDFLTTKVPMKTLLTKDYTIYYGLAPWRAMNYAIYWYNTNRVTDQVNHPCTMHFENNSTGYSHRYPVLTPGKIDKVLFPDIEQWNPVSQTN